MLLPQGESFSCVWSRCYPYDPLARQPQFISALFPQDLYLLFCVSYSYVPLFVPTVPLFVQLDIWGPSMNPHSPPDSFFLTPSQVLWILLPELSSKSRMLNHVQVLPIHKNLKKNKKLLLFPGGTVVKNLPANAGDTGSSPGPGRSHMPRSN